jgi:hypothetical protein
VVGRPRGAQTASSSRAHLSDVEGDLIGTRHGEILRADEERAAGEHRVACRQFVARRKRRARRRGRGREDVAALRGGALREREDGRASGETSAGSGSDDAGIGHCWLIQFVDQERVRR